jgi:hypothetical protein
VFSERDPNPGINMFVMCAESMNAFATRKIGGQDEPSISGE